MKSIAPLFLIFFIIFTACDSEIQEVEEELITNNAVLFSDVVKDESGKILENAVVTIFAGNERFIETTNDAGQYNLNVNSELFPQEGFIAMSIIAPGHHPLNVVYEAPLMTNRIYDSKSKSHSLESCPNCLTILDPNAPELFHLGDDEFGGAVNSKFQKESDGLEISFDFVNNNEYSKLRIHFEAKGIQSDLFDVGNAISFGNDELELFLPDSRMDGDYESFTYEIDNDQLFEKITFKATNQGSDWLGYDDWEFNAFHIEGIE